MQGHLSKMVKANLELLLLTLPDVSGSRPLPVGSLTIWKYGAALQVTGVLVKEVAVRLVMLPLGGQGPCS